MEEINQGREIHSGFFRGLFRKDEHNILSMKPIQHSTSMVMSYIFPRENSEFLRPHKYVYDEYYSCYNNEVLNI